MARTRRRKKHTVFKTFAILSAFVLVIGATVAITLALLNASSETRQNTFVGDAGLDVFLDEPNWEDKNADNYAPEQIIPKDPILTNTSTLEKNVGDIGREEEVKNNSEYVAIQLQYQVFSPLVKYTAGVGGTAENPNNWETITYKEFKELAKVQYYTRDSSGNVILDALGQKTINSGFNTINWVAKTPSDPSDPSDPFAENGSKENTIFYYNKILPPKASIVDPVADTSHTTNPLFDEVVINRDLAIDTIFICGHGDFETGTEKQLLNPSNVEWEDGVIPLDTLSKKTWGEFSSKVKGTCKSPLVSDTDPNHADVFEYVKTDNTTTYYVHVGLIPFRINVTGFAVQAYTGGKPMTLDQAKIELDKLMDVNP